MSVGLGIDNVKIQRSQTSDEMSKQSCSEWGQQREDWQEGFRVSDVVRHCKSQRGLRDNTYNDTFWQKTYQAGLHYFSRSAFLFGKKITIDNVNKKT